MNTSSTDDGAVDERRVLGQFCDQHQLLATEVTQWSSDKTTLWNRINALAAAGKPISPALKTLLGLDNDIGLTELAVRSAASSLFDSVPGRADEEHFTCPQAACDRVTTTLPAGAIPRCNVTGKQMLRGE